MRSTPCCQGGKFRLKMVCSLRVSRRELCGRLASAGKALAGMGSILVAFILIAESTICAYSRMCFAYVYQLVSPLAAKW